MKKDLLGNESWKRGGGGPGPSKGSSKLGFDLGTGKVRGPAVIQRENRGL